MGHLRTSKGKELEKGWIRLTGRRSGGGRILEIAAFVAGPVWVEEHGLFTTKQRLLPGGNSLLGLRSPLRPSVCSEHALLHDRHLYRGSFLPALAGRRSEEHTSE